MNEWLNLCVECGKYVRTPYICEKCGERYCMECKSKHEHKKYGNL